jgi:hypothetical protein
MAYMHVALILQGSETIWPSNGIPSPEMQQVHELLKNRPWRKLDI